MLLCFIMWWTSLSRLSFSEAHEGNCTQPLDGIFRERCCKAWGKGQNTEINLFFPLSGSYHKCLEAPEERGSFQLLTCEELGWLPKDSDKHVILVQVQARLYFLRCVHPCSLCCQQVWMKGRYQTVVIKCLGTYCPSLTDKWGSSFLWTNVDCAFGPSIKQARNLKWSPFFLFLKGKMSPDL